MNAEILVSVCCIVNAPCLCHKNNESSILLGMWNIFVALTYWQQTNKINRKIDLATHQNIFFIVIIDTMPVVIEQSIPYGLRLDTISVKEIVNEVKSPLRSEMFGI